MTLFAERILHKAEELKPVTEDYRKWLLKGQDLHHPSSVRSLFPLGQAWRRSEGRGCGGDILRRHTDFWGWKAKNMGISAQCVLLNSSGCKNHWHNEDLVTDIDLGELRRIMTK